MIHTPKVPTNETELTNVLDELFKTSNSEFTNNRRPRFKGLLEVMSSETVILTAIHNIKSNRGSKTAGVDDMIIDDILQSQFSEIIQMVQEKLVNYHPLPVRRVEIPKPGKKNKRPLGIPAIVDRVIQECVRIVIEPIAEAQFFNYSYGFRPMRDSSHALRRIFQVIHPTGYNWVVEGDISKFFDNVNHTILLRALWNFGIRDQRVLAIIKQMLKAGINAKLTNWAHHKAALSHRYWQTFIWTN